MAQAVSQLMTHCHGDDRPECPILASLAGEDGAQAVIETRGASRPRARVRRSMPRGGQ